MNRVIDADDPEPFMRGINTIQLFYDGNRWWIDKSLTRKRLMFALRCLM